MRNGKNEENITLYGTDIMMSESDGTPIATAVNNAVEKATIVEGQISYVFHYPDALTLEEIAASTDLTNKLPSASAVSELNSSLNNTNSYSSNEVIIGKWINEKPIYRKVVTFSNELTVPCDNWVKTGVNAVNMIVLSAKITSMTGIITAGTFDTPLCYTIDGELAIQTARNGHNVTAKHLIIEYTKTTD